MIRYFKLTGSIFLRKIIHMVTSHKGGPSGPRAMRKTTASFNAPGNIGAQSTAYSVANVPGLRTTDIVVGAPQSTTGGIGISMMRPIAEDTLQVEYINQTAGSVDPGANTFDIAILRFS